MPGWLRGGVTSGTGAPLSDEKMDPRVRDAFSAEVRGWGREYLGADPAWAVDYFLRFFHNPLARHLDLAASTALECASGTGLNAIGFVLAGGRSIVGFDLTQDRVDFANELARRLGLAGRARFELCDIHQLPAQRVDVVFSLQTLEHVPRAPDALRALGDRAERAVVLSTPNKLFPRDGHDTGLLFNHWLPQPLRRHYAELRHARSDQFCTFLSPPEVDAVLRDFRLASRAYNFDSLEQWLDAYPCFFPYGKGGGRWLGARRESSRWKVAAAAFDALGTRARLVAPVIEGIYLRDR